jgi:hypothetical protein
MLSDGSLSIAVCDRCKSKVQYTKLRPDGNSPGLKVCPECWDVKDPWRYSAKKADALALQFARPDISLSTGNNFLTDQDGNYILTQSYEYIEV